MPSTLVSDQSASYVKPRPEVRPGYTVRVHERIQEGGKERVQIFEGLVIAVHKGSTPADTTITVRKIASGIGVEKLFALHSPKIEQIEVKKVARVRRAKLFFLRGRRGKAARLSERFTTAEEFAVNVPEEEAEQPAEEATEQKAEEATEQKAEEATSDEGAAAPKEEAKTEEKASAEKEEDKKDQ